MHRRGRPGRCQTRIAAAKEITLTAGYAPIRNVELRLEGRYDDPDTVGGVNLVPKTYQGWVEAIYKF